MSTYRFPLSGKGVAAASSWTLDQGVDISAPAHTPLRAVGDGEIVGHGINGFGAWAPILKLTSGPLSGRFVYYGHAGPGGELPVGTKVHAGDVIGEVGAGIVGISTGPHLEIGFASDAAGQPAGSRTSGAMRALLSSSKVGEGTGGGVISSLLKDLLPHKVDQKSDPLNTGTAEIQQQLGQPAEAAAQATARSMFNFFWDAAKGSALKALVYALLLFGGLALAYGGVKRLTRPKEPTP